MKVVKHSFDVRLKKTVRNFLDELVNSFVLSNGSIFSLENEFLSWIERRILKYSENREQSIAHYFII